MEKENVQIDNVLAHGGFYKTNFIGQNATSAVLKTPVTVMQTAAEGGAWGMAILALYATKKEEPLSAFLKSIFADTEQKIVIADEKEIEKSTRFMNRYRKGLPSEKLISEAF